MANEDILLGYNEDVMFVKGQRRVYNIYINSYILSFFFFYDFFLIWK